MPTPDPFTLAHHLSGTTILDRTNEEPLGALPYPVRTAVLRTAKDLAPDLLHLEVRHETLNYLGGEHAFVDRWRFLDDRTAERLTDRTPVDSEGYASVEDYFERHALRRKRHDGTDEHFAERLFVERVFVPTFGVEALRYLRPQVPFTDAGGRRRRIDFVLEAGKRYAIEIEGATYHDRARVSRERFEDEKRRQADLTVEDYAYLPFSYASLTNDLAKATLNELALDDPVLRPLARAFQPDGETPPSDRFHDLELLFKAFPDRYPTYQKLALALLRSARSEGRRRLVIADHAPRLPLLSIALLDAVALVERVAEMHGLSADLPDVDLYVAGRRARLHDEVLTRYLGDEPGGIDRRLDASIAAVNLHLVEEVPAGLDVTHASAAEALAHDAPRAASGFDAIARLVAPFLRDAKRIPDAKPVTFDRPILDYFARRFFPYAELRPEQIQLVQRALREESGLGILPTGFGKSAIFQLYALLTPRTTLVVSPLKALMRDQIHSLRRRGIVAVNAISSNDSRSEKDAKLRAFAEGRYRMLYVAPERLQVKNFYDELVATLEDTRIGAFVIDEAHCVSEWGHDFRPAYLQIAPLRKALEKVSMRTVPLLGLTATASPVVREDVVSMLELPEDSVVQLSSSDRPNLSLSVHRVEEWTGEAKAETLTELLEETIPRALGTSAKDLVPVGSRPPFEHAGVIFAIYADPHGASTLHEGVHAIADAVTTRVAHDPDLVQVHASRTPKVCPECGSSLYTSISAKEARKRFGANGRSGHHCRSCDTIFYKPRSVANREWEKALLQRQDEFQNDRFPLLVATKGYGMGVDKRNIRFIVHHALSGGLESYYQEAGRAGRDGKQSHVALMYAPPVGPCVDEHLSSLKPPPCVNRWRCPCPYGRKSLCDYGRQAKMIVDTYKGIAIDLELMLDVYDDLAADEAVEAKKDDEIKSKQLALYRLQQQGFVRSYSLEYRRLGHVVFHVDRPKQVTRAKVKERLGTFLRKTRGGSKGIQKTLAQLDRSRPSKERPGQSHLVERAGRILLDRVYEEIPRMRYQMLASQLDYATSHERGECRRVKIRSEFDEGVALEDYECGFCDVCAPDLDFDREQARVPSQDAQIEDVVHRLPELLSRFDVEELPRVVDLALNKGAVAGLFYKVGHTLEHDATNASALYLAGALGRRRPEFRERAMEHLRFGFQEIRRQEIGRDALLLTYREASTVDAREALDWLADATDEFDDVSGLRLLESEAERVYGETSEPSRNLRALRRVRSLASLAPSLEELATEIDEIERGFADLPTFEPFALEPTPVEG